MFGTLQRPRYGDQCTGAHHRSGQSFDTVRIYATQFFGPLWRLWDTVTYTSQVVTKFFVTDRVVI